MIRLTPSRRWIVASAIVLAFAAAGCGDKPAEKAGDHGEAAAADYERGPHRGRMLRDGDFALEITIFEEGPEPLFRLYPYLKDKPLDPRQVQATIALTRLGPKVDRFTFIPTDDYLAGPGVVSEPHSFDVAVAATQNGKRSTWAYQSYEGRTVISADAGEKNRWRLMRPGLGVSEVSEKLRIIHLRCSDTSPRRIAWKARKPVNSHATARLAKPSLPKMPPNANADM